MIEMAHNHKVKTSIEHGYSYCVAGPKCDPRAHGWVTVRQACGCGATREVNVNQGWSERSPWWHAKGAP